jgi:hypothetical protein
MFDKKAIVPGRPPIVRNKLSVSLYRIKLKKPVTTRKPGLFSVSGFITEANPPQRKMMDNFGKSKPTISIEDETAKTLLNEAYLVKM